MPIVTAIAVVGVWALRGGGVATRLVRTRPHAQLAGQVLRLDHQLREAQHDRQMALLQHQQALRDLDVARKALLSSHGRLGSGSRSEAGNSDFGVPDFAPTMRLPRSSVQ